MHISLIGGGVVFPVLDEGLGMEYFKKIHTAPAATVRARSVGFERRRRDHAHLAPSRHRLD